MPIFIFDVDGTLTPSRQQIDKNFKEFFIDFCKSTRVCLVSGSDRQKTLEQLGEEVLSNIDILFSCSGNDVWKQDTNIFSSDWELDSNVIDYLITKLNKSKFYLRTGNHLERRPGMVNFSVVGRNATLGERALYIKWDSEHLERATIANEFNSLFPGLQATVGGETGIDISPKGQDKSQIIKYFSSEDRLFFFGDKMDTEGNDYPLASVIQNKNLGECFTVKDWKHTFKLLSVMKVLT